MEVSPSRATSLSPLKGVGDALTRWEGLKTWQIRQEALFIQSPPSNNQGYALDDSPNWSGLEKGNFAMPALDAGLISASVKQPEPSARSCGPLLDLSVIQEVDEDTRTTVDLATTDDEAPTSPSRAVVLSPPRPPLTIPALRIVPGASTAKPTEQPRPPARVKAAPPTETGEPARKVPTRPFLKRGQGLVRFNLRPDQVLRPYRSNKKPPLDTWKAAPDPSKTTATKKAKADCPIALSRLRLRREAATPSSEQQRTPSEEVAPPAPLKTWSHLLAQDRDDGESPCSEPGAQQGISGVQRLKEDGDAQRWLGSPKRAATLRGGNVSFAEDDEEALAAYIALEQHIGDTSFCSTSSTVDRLIAKSTRLFFGAESPRRRYSPRKAQNAATHHSPPPVSLRKIRFDPEESSATGGRIAANPVRSATGGRIDANPVHSATGGRLDANPVRSATGGRLDANPVRSATGGRLDANPVRSATGDRIDANPLRPATRLFCNEEDDWRAEDEEIRKRFHSESGADLEEAESADSDSEVETETETESSETEDEVDLSTPRKPVEVMDLTSFNGAADVSAASIDLVIESINRKVEEHLKRLCSEIESLQKSNASSKNQVKALKKQVRQLERKLATQHLSSERKLAEERDAAAAAIAQEKAKVVKEKSNFERFCREQKKKEAPPALLDQLEILRKDMVTKEESWRAERAKARGTECNLRIQITNLKKENEKLKAENSKLRREKETAVNAAKAKNVSNTKVINAIANHISKAKPQVTVTKEKISPRRDAAAPSLNAGHENGNALAAPTETQLQSGTAQVQPTIGVFPKTATAPSGGPSRGPSRGSSRGPSGGSLEPEGKNHDWSSSDEEVDLGPLTPEKLTEELNKASSGANNGGGFFEPNSLNETLLAETEARYEALFNGGGGLDDCQPAKKGAGAKNRRAAEEVITHADGSVERRRNDGTSVVTLPDGTQKRRDKNGSVMTVPLTGFPIHVAYYNGDQQERHEDGSVHYFYAKTNTWQTTHPDGREELLLPNGVVGQKKSNGSQTVTVPAEKESRRLEKGSASAALGSREAREMNHATETVVLLPNGDQEIRTKDYVERRFKDGTVRFLYNDGIQKTIYISGRIRIKDGNGKLLLDTATNQR